MASQWSRLREALRPRTRWREWRQRDVYRVPRGTGSPADFVEWAGRRRTGRVSGFPEQWSARTDLPIESPSRLGVVVHVYYPELLPELLLHVEQIPVPYDLLVTNASGKAIDLPAEGGNRRHVRAFDVANHGRDILPLVSLVNAGLLDPYHVVLKVHTKKSEWRAGHELGSGGDGAAWRTQLITSLLGSGDNISQILSSFAERPDLGLVTADGSVLGPEMWGDNEGNVANLVRRLELPLDTDTLRFAAGSMYWVRGFGLQGLRGLGLGPVDFEPEAGQVNATTAHAVERAIGVLLTEAGLSIEERRDLAPPMSAEAWQRYGDRPLRPRARAIPFYLPQFHPIPENDRWWGKGFTEWTNVAAAGPVYLGHYQPRLPQDLGFYDLRLDAVRRAQRDIAASVGIEGFMYYYYWFAGKRLLDAPIEALRRSDLDQPFCVMWANENWTRRWDGRESDVLIAQDYDRVPAEDFIDDILPLLADHRYLTIGGRKVVAVYRPGQLGDLPKVVAAWRDRARAAGVGELFLMNVDVADEFDGLRWTLAEAGLDGSLGFPPHNHHLAGVPHADLDIDRGFAGIVFSYDAMAEHAERRLRSAIDPTYFPGVMVAFDNTPRRPAAPDIWVGANPYSFRRWLAAAVRAVLPRGPDERVVFINAWNEWAEGAVLEPTDKFGRTYLLAVRDVLFG
jgi:lipopolysaccharide biosynthesis protein